MKSHERYCDFKSYQPLEPPYPLDPFRPLNPGRRRPIPKRPFEDNQKVALK